jgi:hypothetical protein
MLRIARLALWLGLPILVYAQGPAPGGVPESLEPSGFVQGVQSIELTRRGPAFAGAPGHAGERKPEHRTEPSSGEPPLPVEAFVRGLYVEGLPLRERFRYGPDAVPRLLEMLASGRESLYTEGHILSLLGAIGDEHSAPVLILHLLRASSALSASEPDGTLYTAVSALHGLSLLGVRLGDRRAIEFLAGAARSRPRAGSSAAGVYPDEARARLLAELALASLAGTGHAQAYRALRDIERAGVYGPERIRESLELHRAVSRGGLEWYLHQP